MVIADQGDATKQLDLLYRKHVDAMYRLALRFGSGDEQWALDRTQEVFVRLAENLNELHDVDDIGGWLYRVLANLCLMTLRRRQRWRRVAQVLGIERPHAVAADRELQARRDLTALERALALLPAKQRAVVVLVEIEGHKQVEVARILDLSKGQISRLHAAALATLQAGGWELSRHA
jgi:RNA polymerase sigma-70 factor, ECF subfamily